MARLFSRSDWRLATIGILSGILTAALVLVFWFRSIGVGPAVVERMIGIDTDTTLDTVAAGPRAAARGALLSGFRERVESRLARRPVPARPLRGELRIVARNVVWREESGAQFARVPTVSGRLRADALNRGDVVLRSVRLESPDLRLRQAGGSWNYEQVLGGLLDGAPGDGAPDPAPPRTVRIEGLVVADGRVAVAMPDGGFTATNLDANLGVVALSGPGLAAPELELTTVSATLDPAGPREPLQVAAAEGRLRFVAGVTEFQLAALTVAGTRLEELAGSWDPDAPGYGLTATGRAPSVRLADVRFLAPERIPAEGTASFRFSVEPLAGDGTALLLEELAASSGESRVAGSLALEVFPGRLAVERLDLRLEPVALALVESLLGRPLPYTGTLTGTLRGPGTAIDVDVVASLRAPDVAAPFRISLLGGVALTRSGLELQQLRVLLNSVPLAALRPVAPGLPFTGAVSGMVTLNGSPATTPITLDVRLELGTGQATVAGTLDLTGAVPGYDVSGRLSGVQLRSVLAGFPPVGLAAAFSLEGSGFDPATAEARVRLDGRFTGWRAQRRDTVAVAATVSGGAALIDTLLARLAGADLQGAGRWRFVQPLEGALRYRLAVADLAPFGPYLPRLLADTAAGGSLQAEGTISGPLDALRLAGRLEGDELAAAQWGAGRLEAEYTMALTGVLPELVLDLTGSDVVTPTLGNYRTLTADVRLVTPTLDVDIRGIQADSGEVAVVAQGTIPSEGARTLYLRRAWFDLEEGRWELARQARLTWGGNNGLRVSELELVNPETEGRLQVNGRIYPLARLDLQANVSDLPLEQAQRLLGREPRASGRLWAELTIRPPGAAPVIRGTFRVDQAALDSVRFAQLEGTLDYAGGSARTELLAVLDSAAGRFELSGTLPLRIAFADSFQLGIADAGPLAATLRAERVSLAPFALFVGRVRDLQGMINGTVTMEGSVSDPRLGGQLALTGGTVTVPDLNQTFDSIAGSLAFNGRRAEVRELRAFRDGWVRINGTATFEELGRPVLALTADLDEFQPTGVDEHPDAAVSGRATLTGELDALVLSGAVTVDDGYLAVPQFGRAYEADFSDVLDPTPTAAGVAARGPGTWLTNLQIRDLQARFGEGAWFQALEATAQLSGDLTINRSGDELRVVGTLEGERGTYTLVAGPIVRRFEVTRAEVRFRGEAEPNPDIDITARRVMLDETGRRVEVEVRITGTLETPQLGLASADAPAIPESELLAYLLFGRPTFALGEDITATGTDIFNQTFFGGFAELASIELERSLSADLGLQLDLFQVQFGQGLAGLGTSTVVVGRQLSNDFFLTLESGLGALLSGDGATASNWAIRLEWAIDRRSSLQTGWEPVNRARLTRGFGAAVPPAQDPRHQLFFEYRRRWEY